MSGEMEQSIWIKNLLKAEQLAFFIGSILLYTYLIPYAWWWYAVLFLAPDLGILAYTINEKTGAFFYNLLHHQGIMILLMAIGFFTGYLPLLGIGIIFLGHSAFDRLFSYGLKYGDHFKHTHLGWIK